MNCTDEACASMFRPVGQSIAYVSQEPWIQNLTIKENILFGATMTEKCDMKVRSITKMIVLL